MCMTLRYPSSHFRIVLKKIRLNVNALLDTITFFYDFCSSDAKFGRIPQQIKLFVFWHIHPQLVSE